MKALIYCMTGMIWKEVWREMKRHAVNVKELEISRLHIENCSESIPQGEKSWAWWATELLWTTFGSWKRAEGGGLAGKEPKGPYLYLNMPEVPQGEAFIRLARPPNQIKLQCWLFFPECFIAEMTTTFERRLLYSGQEREYASPW